VILLDSYALIAFARDEPAAAEVEALLRDTVDTAITSVNLFEVVDYLVRRAGWPEEGVRVGLSLLIGETVQVVAVGSDIAWRGASVRAAHYVKGSCEVSLADCILLASAVPGDRIATSDPALAFVARALGIELVPLSDSRGRKP
jgi:predicted nucleic acid-binding protein